jgi:hypothetical protein
VTEQGSEVVAKGELEKGAIGPFFLVVSIWVLMPGLLIEALKLLR